MEFTSPRPIWYVKLKVLLRLADEVGLCHYDNFYMGTLLEEGESPDLDDDYVVSGDDTNLYYVHDTPLGRVINGFLRTHG